jgi:hypothetical protein
MRALNGTARARYLEWVDFRHSVNDERTPSLGFWPPEPQLPRWAKSNHHLASDTQTSQ